MFSAGFLGLGFFFFCLTLVLSSHYTKKLIGFDCIYLAFSFGSPF